MFFLPIERLLSKLLGNKETTCRKHLTFPERKNPEFWHTVRFFKKYGARNLEMTIRFSLKSRASERFHRPEMSQIKAEISLRTNVKLNFQKNVGCQ